MNNDKRMEQILRRIQRAMDGLDNECAYDMKVLIDEMYPNEVEITKAMVKSLRMQTGYGLMECLDALKACNGQMFEASEWLRHHR